MVGPKSCRRSQRRVECCLVRRSYFETQLTFLALLEVRGKGYFTFFLFFLVSFSER